MNHFERCMSDLCHLNKVLKSNMRNPKNRKPFLLLQIIPNMQQKKGASFLAQTRKKRSMPTKNNPKTPKKDQENSMNTQNYLMHYGHNITNKKKKALYVRTTPKSTKKDARRSFCVFFANVFIRSTLGSTSFFFFFFFFFFFSFSILGHLDNPRQPFHFSQTFRCPLLLSLLSGQNGCEIEKIL